MSKSACIRASADDEHIARAHPMLKAVIEQDAINKTAGAESDSDQADGQENDEAGDVFGLQEVERACEQQAGGEADLNAEPLFMENVGQASGVIQLQAPARDDESDGKAAQKRQQDSHGAAMNERALPKAFYACEGSETLPVECCQAGANEYRDGVQRHPEPCSGS